MDGARTRGHPAALAAVAAMIRGRAPHAILLVGPPGVGKSTLAVDLAAGLLCTAEDVATRPCGSCRACRLAFGGGHPDVHRLGPEGPGRQVVIGGAGSRARGVRDLIGELALLPVEGGARVAIVESAERMNEDAQAALLKTLEEPPAGVVIILCADAEEPLLPTIRSRAARLRLGPVAVRDIEAILGEHGVADAPTAARLARIAAGRPGVAMAWAADPEALVVRGEIARSLLDLLDAGPAERLAGVRAAAAQGARLRVLAEPLAKVASVGAATTTSAAAVPEVPADDADGEPDDIAPTRTPATERRRAAEALVTVWADVARDLALAAHGVERDVRDTALLDETTAAAARLIPADLTATLDRIDRAALLLRSNVSPELVLDDLAVRWPRPRPATATTR